MINKRSILLLLSCMFTVNMVVALDTSERLSEQQLRDDVALVDLLPQLRIAILELEKILSEQVWSSAFKSLCEELRNGCAIAAHESVMQVVDECLTSIALYECNVLLDNIKSAIQEYKKELLAGDLYVSSDDIHTNEEDQLSSRGFKSKKFRKIFARFLTVTRGLTVTGPATFNAPVGNVQNAALTVNGNEVINGVLQVNGSETVTGTLSINGTLVVNGVVPAFGTVDSVSNGTGITITGDPTSNPIVNLTVPVSIANGGTNATEMVNANGVVYYDGTKLNTTAVGTSGQILTSRGPGLAPIFVTGSGGSSIATIDANTGAIAGSTVAIQGGNNITTTGTGTIMTVDVSGTTNHAVQIGNSTGSLNSVAVGATNTVLLGNTGANPSFGTVPNAATTATSANVVNALVARDGSGDISVGTITAATGLVSSSFGSGMVQSNSSGVLASIGATNYAVQVGNALGTFSSLPVGTAGEVLLGSSAAPSFITPTAGSGLSVTANATTLSYGISAPISIINGGTNTTSMINTDGVVYYDGTKLNTTAVGTVNQLLTSNGAGVAPTFQAFTITNDSGSVSGHSLFLNATNESGSTVKFSGSGAAMTLTMSDADSNTAVGNGAGSATMGTINTVFGESAGARMNNVNGNCAFGQASLLLLGGTSGNGNYNCAFGQAALQSLVSGASNIAIGQIAGSNLTSNESGNIYLGSSGVQGESDVFRVNADLAAAYIGGISGVTVSGAPVLISVGGQLGVSTSSRKYKDNIRNITPSVAAKVLDLRPVTFNYKKSEQKNEAHYGLIAEEVEAVIPELVIYDKNNEPQTVKYHELPVLLLVQIKLLSDKIEMLNAKVATLEAKWNLPKI